MAAQDDEETKYAINNAFLNAQHPERVFIGIALTAQEKKFLNDVKTIMSNNPNVFLDYKKQKRNDLSTLGIGQGRKRASALYQNQDYMLQVDCHSYFDTNWDSKLIDLFEEAKKDVEHEKLLLSCIPPAYRYEDNEVVKVNEPTTRYATYVLSDFFISVVPKWQEVDIIKIRKEKFLPAHKLNPAMVFGDHNFAKDPGICKTAIFYDEDWTQQLNLFDKDFVFVFPNIKDFPIRHLDGNFEIKGHQRKFFLDYLNQKNNDLIHERLKENYLSFISNPENQEKINKYYKYSKAHAKKGYISIAQDFVPKRYRIEE